MDLAVINATVGSFIRSELDTGGYTSVLIYKNKEPQGVALPFVRYSYQILNLTGNKPTTHGGLQNNYRILLSLLVVGSLEGSGRQTTEAIGGLLRTSFNNKRLPLSDKIQSDISGDLITMESEAGQVSEASFSANCIITYP